LRVDLEMEEVRLAKPTLARDNGCGTVAIGGRRKEKVNEKGRRRIMTTK